MNKKVQLIAAILLMVAHPTCAFAEDSPMDEGIREYTAGKYSDALNHLGAALNSEFNNAKLHYYMGSCYLKLSKKEAAVREFRIAYALEPTGTAGQYAKQALGSLGAEGGGGGGSSVTASSGSTSSTSDVFSKALQDQKALGRAIADYDSKRSGGNSFPAANFPPPASNNYQPGNGQFFPPGIRPNMPGQGAPMFPPFPNYNR